MPNGNQRVPPTRNDTKPRQRGDQQKGLIYIGKLVTALLALLLVVCILTSTACAATPEEIQDQITACQVIKQTAHQMAECARQLGYPEDHTIIRCAQEKWREAAAKEQELMRELSKQLDASGPVVQATTWTGSKLTKRGGVNYGPTGKETYYNLNMSGVVSIMRNMGYTEKEYPYWVREDGCKMLGPFVIAAANLQHFPRGSIVESSLGWTLICDTGHLEWSQLDIAVIW